jgi:membrane protein required for colicin V production
VAVLDIICCLVIGFGAFKGYKKGILIEILVLLSISIAVILGFKLLGFSSVFIKDLLGSESLLFIAPYLSFAVVFFPSLYVFKYFSFQLKKSIKLSFLGSFDAILGAILGMFTHLLILSLGFWLIEKMGITFPEKWANDVQLYPYCKAFGPELVEKVSNFLPGKINWMEYLEKLKQI